MQVSYHGDSIASTMFMTADAANILIIALAASTFNIQISWLTYALAASLPGLVALLIIPYLLYKL